MADSEDRAVVSPGSTSSQLVASEVLEARYRQVMRDSTLEPIEGENSNAILLQLFNPDMVGAHFTAEKHQGLKKSQGVVKSITDEELNGKEKLILEYFHVQSGFTSSKLRCWVLEVKQQLTEFSAQLLKKLGIKLDPTVFANALFQPLLALTDFAKVTIEMERLTVSKRVNSSGEIELFLDEDDQQEDNIGILEALLDGRLEQVKNERYPTSEESINAALTRLSDLTGTRFFDEIEGVNELVIKECLLGETFKPRSGVKKFTGVVASFFLSEGVGYKTVSIAGTTVASGAASVAAKRIASETFEEFGEAILKKGTRVGVVNSVKTVATDVGFAIVVDGGLLALKTFIDYKSFAAGEMTPRMASRAFVRNLSNHSGSLIGSLIGSIIGFFTLGPLGSIGFGALGGLIGVLISRFVGDKCLKSSKLALWLEKKLKTKQQQQEEQEQRHTVQTTLPALTAS